MKVSLCQLSVHQLSISTSWCLPSADWLSTMHLGLVFQQILFEAESFATVRIATQEWRLGYHKIISVSRCMLLLLVQFQFSCLHHCVISQWRWYTCLPASTTPCPSCTATSSPRCWLQKTCSFISLLLYSNQPVTFPPPPRRLCFHPCLSVC